MDNKKTRKRQKRIEKSENLEIKEGKNKNLKTAVIRVISKPLGFIAIDEKNELVVYEENLNTALDRDEVEYESIGRGKAKVKRIIKRNKTEFVSMLEGSQGAGLKARPTDHRFYKSIELFNYSKDAKPGLKALVRIDSWQNMSQNPRGSILKIIGEAGEHETEMQSILLDKGIVYDFPEEVEKEAQKIADEYKKMLSEESVLGSTPPPAPSPRSRGGGKEDDSLLGGGVARRDFRDIVTFTIDPADAKDFDDALSYKKIDENIIEVGVHIADVSHFVTVGSALDREARKRSFSTYLVDRTIPMLPEVLSNDLCSLNPNADRYAFGAVFKINKESGEILDRWFGKTLINSDKRFSYEEAQELIDGVKKSNSNSPSPEQGEGARGGVFKPILTALNRLANIYREQNRKEGAIEFETEEVKFVLDGEGVPVKVYKKPRLDTMKMIEEWMLLANREVAKYIASKIKNGHGASIYRIHDLPNVDRLEELAIFVRALGYELPIRNGAVSAKDLNVLFSAIEGHTAESLVKTAAVRSMSKAIYSTKNIGHFGLAFKYYTHFTSPIRRYPDLVVHRILENHLNGGKIGKDEYAKFEKIALEASEKEVKVQEAERDSIKYKQVEYMQSKVGETFECTISGVTEWGMYLEDPESKAEGLVRLRDMEGDTFELDAKNYCIVGTSTKKKYTLGDKVKAKLTAADLDRKTLDFKLI